MNLTYAFTMEVIKEYMTSDRTEVLVGVQAAERLAAVVTRPRCAFVADNANII